MKSFLKLSVFAVAVLASSLVMTGCNAGDENPITPEKMQEISNTSGQDRANFKPKGADAPRAAGSGAGTTG